MPHPAPAVGTGTVILTLPSPSELRAAATDPLVRGASVSTVFTNVPKASVRATLGSSRGALRTARVRARGMLPPPMGPCGG